jgi:hypothetical protein
LIVAWIIWSDDQMKKGRWNASRRATGCWFAVECGFRR